MGLENGMILLSLVATLSSLLTEAVKKVFNLDGKKVSLNLLAAIVSVVTALLVSFGYLIIFDISFTPKVIVYIVALCILGFISSTTSYDKVKETIKQLDFIKKLNN